MQGGRNLRIVLIFSAIALVILVYILPKKPVAAKSEKPVIDKEQKSVSFSFDKYISESKAGLSQESAVKITAWESELGTNQTLSLYDSIGKVWDENKNPGVSAGFFEQKALKVQSEKEWLSAAYRYFDAYKMSKDSAQAQYFVAKAINCYSKVIELNPKNSDAKTDLGVLYAEGTAEPMKGIMMLREVIAENPKHENAQLNLGFLSMKSAQYDKAIERFKKVLEINPGRIDMHIYLGEAYVRLDDKEKAIENFNIFKNLSNDSEMIKNVDEYIASIKTPK